MKPLLTTLMATLCLTGGLAQASDKTDPAAMLQESRRDVGIESFATLSAPQPLQASTALLEFGRSAAPSEEWALRVDPEIPHPARSDWGPEVFGPRSGWTPQRWGGIDGDGGFDGFMGDDGWHHHHHHIAAVPEPSSWLLFAFGAALVGVAVIRRPGSM